MAKAISDIFAVRFAPSSSLLHLCPCVSFFRGGNGLEGTYYLIFERGRMRRRLLRIDHDLRRERVLCQCLIQDGKIQSHRVPHAPLNAIALHRTAEWASNSKTHLRTFRATAVRTSVFGAEDIEESHAAGKMTAPIPIDSFKAGMLQQSRPARETEPPRRIERAAFGCRLHEGVLNSAALAVH